MTDAGFVRRSHSVGVSEAETPRTIGFVEGVAGLRSTCYRTCEEPRKLPERVPDIAPRVGRRGTPRPSSRFGLGVLMRPDIGTVEVCVQLQSLFGRSVQ